MTNFLHYVENQFKTTVQCIRSDNALELTGGLLKKFYADKGIINQTSRAYTP